MLNTFLLLDPKRINLVLAMRAVKNIQLTIAQASRAYGLKYFKKTAHHLTASEESALAQYATVLSESGIPLRRIDITKCAIVSNNLNIVTAVIFT